MTPFLDSSFLFKLYVPEPRSSEAIALFSQFDGEPVISMLSDVEMASGLNRKLPPSSGLVAYQRYQRNRADGLYRVVALEAAVLALATELSERYGQMYRLRSLDAIHLATTVHHGLTAIGTFDDRMIAVAGVLGLQVVPGRS